MLLVREELAIGDGVELAVVGREPHGDDALHELLGAPTVLDEVRDRDHLQVVPLAVRARSGTRAIVPSSFMISQTTPAGMTPASRARSTAASV